MSFLLRLTMVRLMIGVWALGWVQLGVADVTVTVTGAATARAGEEYTVTITASGGEGPYVFTTLDPQTAPFPQGNYVPEEITNGLRLTGKPSQVGSFTTQAKAVDKNGLVGISSPFSLTVAPPILALSPAANTTITVARGEVLAQTFTATGGSGYTYSSTTLPAGLSLNANTGVLSGISTTVGTFNFSVTATDRTTGTGAPFSITQAYTLVVSPPTISLPPLTANAIAGQQFIFVPTASGGQGPYTYQMTAGALPPGFAPIIQSSGRIFGVPTTTGNYTFTVRATDTNTYFGERSYTLTVANGELSITPTTLPQAVASNNYQQTLSASGGVAPYQYAVTSGSLPAGLSLTSAGVLSGVASTVGDSSFAITVTDSTAGSAGSKTQQYTLSVVAPTLAITPATLAAARDRAPYQQNLSASGGQAPYQFALTSGTLPNGMSLSSTGTLSGTPEQTGSFPITIEVTDALNFKKSIQYDVQVSVRENPAQDSAVKALMTTQQQVIQRFGYQQQLNVMQRMSSTHGERSLPAVSNQLMLQLEQTCVQTSAHANSPCRSSLVIPMHALAAATSPTESATNSTWGVWMAGTLRMAQFTDENANKLTLDSDGITIGVDYSVSKRWLVGAALGYGNARNNSADLNQRYRSDAVAYAVSLYSSYSAANGFFIDGMLAHQQLDFDVERRLTTPSIMLSGERAATQQVVSLATGFDWMHKAWKLSPYVRMDALSGQLDAFAESGAPTYALQYDAGDISTKRANFGLNVLHRAQYQWGDLMPRGYVEFQRDLSQAGDQRLRYLDLPNAEPYLMPLASEDRHRINSGLGVQMQRKAWSLGLDYQRTFATGIDSDQNWRMQIDRRF